MEAVISESLFERQKGSFDTLNRNWVFILLYSNNNNDDNNNNDNNNDNNNNNNQITINNSNK